MCVHAVCKCFSGEQPDASFKFLKYIAHMLDSRCFFLSFQTRESEQSLGRLGEFWLVGSREVGLVAGGGALGWVSWWRSRARGPPRVVCIHRVGGWSPW